MCILINMDLKRLVLQLGVILGRKELALQFISF